MCPEYPRSNFKYALVSATSTKKSSLCGRAVGRFVLLRCVSLHCTPDKMDFTRQHFFHQFWNRCLQEKKKGKQFSKCFMLSLLAASKTPKSYLSTLTSPLTIYGGDTRAALQRSEREQYCTKTKITQVKSCKAIFWLKFSVRVFRVTSQKKVNYILHMTLTLNTDLPVTEIQVYENPA